MGALEQLLLGDRQPAVELFPVVTLEGGERIAGPERLAHGVLNLALRHAVAGQFLDQNAYLIVALVRRVAVDPSNAGVAACIVVSRFRVLGHGADIRSR